MIIKSNASPRLNKILASCGAGLFLMTAAVSNAAVTLESSTKIADNALHFDGTDIDGAGLSTSQMKTDSQYHYKFGRSISAHGDSVKTYKHYVFMTWYRGGKDDRHVMLTRYNSKTGSIKTIEFPHQHNGFQGNWWIGESHNTIGLAISPKNGTIHMVYDLHAYDDTSVYDNPSQAKFDDDRFKDDFFRYSYSVPGAAEAPDEEFTLEKQFVKDTSEVSEGPNDYKHLTMTGDLADKRNFASLTYPKFYETPDGELLLYMRWGGNNNGAYYFNKYDSATQKWSTFTPFNYRTQKSHGNAYNWGLYGFMKYINGKLRVGFQQRSSNNNDKYLYQNGIYYAYSDHPDGLGDWKNHKGEDMTWPLVDSDEIFVYEPGNLVETEQANKVRIVDGFDWTVTAKGDIHFIHKTKDLENNKTVYGHTYKPAGASEFITSTDFAGASNIYTSGNDIYIIGLSNSKPYVEVAKGGTNEFTRVYEATSGNFQHGVVNVKDGKVFYYLMENGSGAQRPLHLQVIDLGIEKATVSFDQTEQTVIEGYQTLSISAQAVVEDSSRTIDSVALYVNDELVSTLTSAPYQWSEQDAKLQTLPVGTHTVKAVTIDNTGLTAEAFMTINVVKPVPTVEFTQSEITLDTGYTDVNVAVEAATPDAQRSITNVSLYIDDQLVSIDDEKPYQWTQTNSALTNLSAGDYTLKAVVTDSNGDTAQASIPLKVMESKPIVSFQQSNLNLEEGYSSLSVSAVASSPVATREISQVALYVNDQLIRSDTTAPYNWGHTTAFQQELLNLPVGTHTLKAIATDNQGQTGQASITLTVTAKANDNDNSNNDGTPQEPESESSGGTPTPLLMLILILAAIRKKYR
ncbi:hypothetical protein DS2_07818 [Catenovulum agarivorans DS-2]|uniref:Uncharacterized protein n=1 Tax=Catenovulum agarivorans DS-2 TaxID=1328313 RepID=W7QCA6_9ALTE|nr:Ig-like domain-containing protein [Catenovulum agarivorans]EWH10524.1 hypothetical protein DS2_07818 [Catenovulum agarivorans DS-2]